MGLRGSVPVVWVLARSWTLVSTMGRVHKGVGGEWRMDLWGRRLGAFADTRGRTLKRPAPSKPLREGRVMAIARDSLAFRVASVGA